MLKILADSRNELSGDRVTTFLIPIWKVLQAELRTHRSTGQSHYSSRAIPTQKIIKQITENPFIPQWYEYQKGMSGSDTLSPEAKEKAEVIWRSAMRKMIDHVQQLTELGIAKEQRNRLLEPFMVGDCVVTASDYAWNHFFSLRCSEGVQPEFKSLAITMREMYKESIPKELKIGEWHIAFEDNSIEDLTTRLYVSCARCARTSYLNHEGKIDLQKDINLFHKLVADEHLTPLEHQLQAVQFPKQIAQYKGFKSFRYIVENKGLDLYN